MVERPNINIVILEENAVEPKYAHYGDSCMDLSCLRGFTIKPGEIKKVRTGIGVEMPPGFEVQIRSRSGLSSKGLVVTNSPGTIDNQYRGEIVVLVSNTSPEPMKFKAGDRIAQMAVCPIAVPFIHVVRRFSSKTDRGDGGFGSTGV